MRSLDDASLSPVERRVLDRAVPQLEQEFGDALHGIWLYGSRARGEPPHDESDIDLLVVVEGDEWDNLGRVIRLFDAAADAEGTSPVWFATNVYTPARVANRREIRSFFLQEVDRDKIVLSGRP
jgi:predicted nucleotidyltransferase